MDLPKYDVPDGCVLIGMHVLSYSHVSNTYVFDPAVWFLVATANSLVTVSLREGAIIGRNTDAERNPEEWLTSAVLIFPRSRRFGYLCLRTGDLYVWL